MCDPCAREVFAGRQRVSRGAPRMLREESARDVLACRRVDAAQLSAGGREAAGGSWRRCWWMGRSALYGCAVAKHRRYARASSEGCSWCNPKQVAPGGIDSVLHPASCEVWRRKRQDSPARRIHAQAAVSAPRKGNCARSVDFQPPNPRTRMQSSAIIALQEASELGGVFRAFVAVRLYEDT